MSDPREKLPSLEDPKFLTDLVAKYKDRPDLIQKGTNEYLAQVNKERMARQARLAELSMATAPARAKAVEEAFKQVGSQAWLQGTVRMYEGTVGPEGYGVGQSKCNLFVYEMLTQAGARVEMELRDRTGTNFQHAYPPLANNWADASFPIPGFEVLVVPPDTPQPGDVAARKDTGSGHVGIVVGANKTVSATPEDGVVHNDWGFRPEQKGEVVYRRYVGWPQDLGSSPDTSTKTSGVAYDTVPPVPEKTRDRNKCSPGRNGK